MSDEVKEGEKWEVEWEGRGCEGVVGGGVGLTSLYITGLNQDHLVLSFSTILSYFPLKLWKFLAQSMSFDNAFHWSIALSCKLNFLTSFFGNSYTISCPLQNDCLGIMKSLTSIFFLPSTHLFNIMISPLFFFPLILVVSVSQAFLCS